MDSSPSERPAPTIRLRAEAFHNKSNNRKPEPAASEPRDADESLWRDL
jgi:hypothetical protein